MSVFYQLLTCQTFYLSLHNRELEKELDLKKNEAGDICGFPTVFVGDRPSYHCLHGGKVEGEVGKSL